MDQFQNFAITLVDPPRTNRHTQAFWLWLSNITNMGNKVANVAVQDGTIVSIVPNSPGIDVYCTPYQKLNPNIQNLSTKGTLVPAITALGAAYYTMKTVLNVSGKWFHVKCGMSFDHSTFFVNGYHNNVDYTSIVSLPHESLYSGPIPTLTSDYLRTTYRSGVTISINFNFFSNIGTNAILKNYMLFREYMPNTIRFQF